MMLAGRGFWLLAGLVVLANVGLMGAVVGLTLGAGPRVVATSPPDGAVAVSTQPTIRITFRRPVEIGAPDDALRLDPPVAGTVEADEHGILFRPAEPLLPNTQYRLILGPAVREVGGRATGQQRVTTFRTRSSRLVVLRREGGTWALWTVDPATGQGQQVVQAWEGQAADAPPPAVTTSPDGDRAAYVVPTAGPRWSLWVAGLDGGARRAILADLSGLATAVAWSPRGDLIAYEQGAVLRDAPAATPAGAAGAPAPQPGVSAALTSRIWIVSEDGAQTALVYGRGEEHGSTPSWAPDGARLAFYENRLAAIAIYGFGGTVRSIRSEVRQAVRWSPDGRTLAVVNRSEEQRGQAKISLIRPDEPDTATAFWHAGPQTELWPAWSPDGAALAYVRQDAATSGVWVGDQAGGNPRPLHQDTGWTYSRPTWSADGRAIAFMRQQLRAGSLEASPEIWVVGLDGAARRLPAGGWLVAWAP